MSDTPESVRAVIATLMGEHNHYLSAAIQALHHYAELLERSAAVPKSERMLQAEWESMVDENVSLKARVSALLHDCGKAEVDISERDILIDALKARVAELIDKVQASGALEVAQHSKIVDLEMVCNWYLARQPIGHPIKSIDDLIERVKIDLAGEQHE